MKAQITQKDQIISVQDKRIRELKQKLEVIFFSLNLKKKKKIGKKENRAKRTKRTPR